MKFYRPLLFGLIECLTLVLDQNKIAPHVLESTFKKNKKWGSKDRKALAEAFYEIVKWQLLIKKKIEIYFKDKGQIDWDLVAVYYLASQSYSFEEFIGFQSDKVRAFEQVIEFAQSQNKLELNEDYKIYERYSFPEVLHLKAKTEVKDLEKFYQASQKQAPLFIRANTNKNSVTELKQKLVNEEQASQQFEHLPYGLKLNQKSNLFRTQAFKEGAFEVQDGGSQQIAPFLDVEPGQFVIDACAGGGGKSLHLSNLMENKGRILAMDIHGWKLEELKKRAKRNQCHNIEVRTIESNKVIKRLKDKADRLLLDVPCSGSGVFRRNPDAKYRWSEQAFQEIESLQKTILSSYSTVVKVGGKLVYSTCSVFSSENQKQVEAFLATNLNWQLEDEKSIAVGENDFDGYYMARLVRLS